MTERRISLPIIDDLAVLVASLRQQLGALAGEPRSKGRISRDKMIEVVLVLCARHFITLRCLAELVNRKPDTLRDLLQGYSFSQTRLAERGLLEARQALDLLARTLQSQESVDDSVTSTAPLHPDTPSTSG